MEITRLDAFVPEPEQYKATDPKIKFATISNVWIKMMTFKNVGDFIPGHAHLFDHPTLVSQGSVEVEVAGEITKFTAPAIIYIEKEKIHKITALETNTVVCCIHALRKGTGVDDIISEDMIPKGINAHRVLTDYNLTPVVKPR